MSEQQATTRAVLIGRHHDITAFCSSDPARFVIGGVHYNAEAKRLEATDGAVAIRVPVCDKAEEFPPVTVPSQEAVDCIIRPETIKKGLANVSRNGNLPVIQYAKLTTAVSGEAIKATVAATDLEAEQAVTGKVIEGSYPKLDNVWPTTTPTFAICVDAKQLVRIAEYCVKHAVAWKDSSLRTVQTIRLEFTESHAPIRFSCLLADPMGEHPRMEGVLMPVCEQ